MDSEVPPPLRDAVYTAIGFGVLAFQRAQVLRRDAMREAKALLEAGVPVACRLVADTVEAIEPLVVEAEGRVPEPAQTVLRLVRRTAVAAVTPTGSRPEPAGS